MIEYLINSALWSVGGLFIGFMLGKLDREVRRMDDDVKKIKKEVCDDDDDT